MSLPIKSAEELFLRIFKLVILAVMGLALVAIPLLLASASFQFFQSPNEPAPAQKAPVKENEIRLENLKQWLIDQEKEKEIKPEPKQPVAMSDPTVPFMPDALALYECSLRFAQAAGVTVQGADNNHAKSEQAIELRSRLEDIARTREWRGGPWIKAVVAFGCAAMSDPDIIALKKDDKIPLVLGPLINFHLTAWDKIEIEKRRFEQAELNRVQSVRAAELVRVAAAKANAVAQFTAALVSFCVFMALALYLILAKVEINLRNINESIRLGVNEAKNKGGADRSS